MRFVVIAALAACAGDRPPPEAPGNQAATSAPVPAGVALVRRSFTPPGAVKPFWIWIEPGREAGIDLDDPCCGLSYDGNAYADTLATCIDDAVAECPGDRHAVHPGLADDRVCGALRRCVPLPQVRVVSSDGGFVGVSDSAGNPIETVTDARAAYVRITVPRMGPFVSVHGPSGIELVAVDHGARYTIELADQRVARVTRDP